MQTMIENYTNFPGEHCGSVAMRGLLHHYSGLELPEAAVFGLGAGVASVYLSGDDLDPKAILFGRTMTMEQDLAAHLGIDYREQVELDDEKAWESVREEILGGRPTMLSGDIFYLDYRDYKVHFPGHRFVLLGFDEEAGQCQIADRIRTEPEVCSLGALAMSRNPQGAMSTHNMWGRFFDSSVGTELDVAARLAISKCAKAMLGLPVVEASESPSSPGTRVVTGVAAASAFAEDIGGWQGRSDGAWIAGFNASCIEKFGNGGGNFRRLYAGFLSWARALDPSLVPEGAAERSIAAADAWTQVSNALFAASKEVAVTQHWEDAAQHARRAAEIESELFSQLAEKG